MPIIRNWFDTPKEFIWEEMTESFFDETKGEKFFTYPLYWLLPYIFLNEKELAEAPAPLWITEIHPSSSFGKINEKEEGSFVIDVPSSFDEYLSLLETSTRKKFISVIRKNQDLTFKIDRQEDIDELWGCYSDRLNELTSREGAEAYTPKELDIRRDFYRSKKISVMSFFEEEKLLAANVSFWNEGIVYDLACLIRPEHEALKRSLGTYAILRNIELAIQKGMKEYDLLSRDYGYKKSYGAKERKLKQFIRCNKQFAFEYGIPLSEIDELVA